MLCCRENEFAAHGPEMKKYIMKKYDWTEQAWESVAWNNFRTAFNSLTSTQLCLITKVIHQWLPVGKQQHRIDPRKPSNCPSCRCVNETSVHVFRCHSTERRESRANEVEAFREYLISIKTDSRVWHVIYNGLLSWQFNPHRAVNVNMAEGPVEDCLRKAITEQNELGWQNFLYGRISLAWGRAQEIAYREREFFDESITKRYYNGNLWMTRTIKALFRLATETWTTRNAALHGGNSDEQKAIRKQTIERRIRDLYQNAPSQLGAWEQRLFETTLETRLTFRLTTQEAWARNIERLIKANKDEERRRQQETAIAPLRSVLAQLRRHNQDYVDGYLG